MFIRKWGLVSLCFVLVAVLVLSPFSYSSVAASVSYTPTATPTTTPTIVQIAISSTDSPSTPTLTFSSPVTSGDVVVVCAGMVDQSANKITTTRIRDALGTPFNSIARITHGPTSNAASTSARIWYGRAESSGTDTVTITVPGYATAALFGYEIAGSSALISSSKGESVGKKGSTSPLVPAYSPPANSIVIACGAFPNAGTVGAGSGYALDQSFTNGAGEHLTGFMDASTTSQFTTANPVSHWTEVSASIA